MFLCCDVFFFVKQKTAYEMRISDWSSDVCSSDLHLGIGLALELVAARDQLLADLAIILDNAVVHHGDPFGGMRMGIGLVRRAMGGPAGMSDADQALHRLVPQFVFQPDDLAFGTARSEEHTSELQSLMRISYAVFCLKKKTQ